MSSTIVEIIVNLKDNVSKSLKSIGGNFGSFSADLKKDLLIGSAGIAAFTATLTKLTGDAGKFQSVSDAYSSMVKDFEVSGDELVKSIKEATSGTVTEMQVMQNFLKANTLIGKAALGESGENFKRFATIAKKSARATGQDVDFMFESIVNGIGRTSTKWLDNTGVVISATKAYEDYAEQLKINADDLTEEQKKIALTNSYLEKAERLYENVAVTAGGVSSTFARLKVATSELAIDIGVALIPMMQSFLDIVTQFVNNYGPKLVSSVRNISNAIARLPEPIQKALLVLVALVPAMSAIGLVLIPLIASFKVLIAVGVALSGVLSGVLMPALSALLTAALGPLLIALAAVAVGLLGVEIASGGALSALHILHNKTKELEAANRAFEQSTIDLKNAQDELTNSELGLEGAQLRVERAEKTLAETTAMYGDESLETREASHNLKLAQDALEDAENRVKTATDNVTTAEQEQKQAMQEVEDKSAELQTAMDEQEAKLDRLRGAWDSVRDAIGRAIDKLKEWISNKGDAGGGGSWGDGHAIGGLVAGNEPILVGERGPELFTPPTSGRIVPNKDIGSGGGGGVVFNVNIGMYAGSTLEKKNVAKELYKALMLEASGQGKTVDQLLALEAL